MKDLPIWVTEVATKNEGTKGFFSTSTEAVLKRVSLETLRASLGDTCQSVVTLLEGIRDDLGEVGGFKLKQVAVQVEINAEGGVELVGTAKVGAKGAFTLTFGE